MYGKLQEGDVLFLAELLWVASDIAGGFIGR